MTATMCLLAYGAVMVYSASSGISVLKGDDTGSGLLLRYLIYGGLGLALLRVLSRRGLGAWRDATPALLLVSFVLLFSRVGPGAGCRCQTAPAAGWARARSSFSRQS